jgi:hypothetical protein
MTTGAVCVALSANASIEDGLSRASSCGSPLCTTGVIPHVSRFSEYLLSHDAPNPRCESGKP